MRKIKSPALRPILLSDIEELKQQGYKPLEAGDASKANSDYFMVMIREKEGGGVYVDIVCPSFLRGSLGFESVGGIAY